MRTRGPAASARIVAAAIVVAACSAATLVRATRPLVLFNVTASEPPGLYVASPAAISVGRIVAFSAPRAAFPYADRRLAYLHRVPMLKMVAAAAGDEVCAVAGRLRINGRDRGPIASRDSQGVDLPRWRGCRRLGSGEVFVFSNRARNSFDSRYFGPVRVRAVIGVYSPLSALLGAKR